MVELVGIIVLVGGGWLAIAALLTTLTYLLPQRVGRAAQAQEEMPGRAFTVGLVNAIFFGVLALWMLQGNELLQLLAVLILLALLGAAAVGLAGLLLLLHNRIHPVTPPQPLPQTWQTAVLLVGAALAPLAGWFVLTPVALLTGLGAAFLTWRRDSSRRKQMDEL